MGTSDFALSSGLLEPLEQAWKDRFHLLLQAEYWRCFDVLALDSTVAPHVYVYFSHNSVSSHRGIQYVLNIMRKCIMVKVGKPKNEKDQK